MEHTLSERRYVAGPGIDKKDYVVPVDKGGTNASTAAEARDELNVIGTDEKNQPQGPLGLDAQGTSEVSSFSDGSSIQGRNSVSGPTKLAVGITQAYTITDYDSLTGYSLERIGDSGTVTRNGAMITYVSPATLGSFGFKLNGRVYNIQTVEPQPLAPTILAPIEGSVDVNEFVVMLSSEFSMNVTSNDTHESSDWQVASDDNFTTIVSSSIADTVNKTNWVSPSLEESTLLYLRIRHKGVTSGYGPWSESVSFTTSADFLPSAEKAILNHYSSGNNIGFGSSFSSSGDGEYVIVGSPTDSVGNNIGSAQLFKRNVLGSYSLQQSFNPSWSASTGSGGSAFGRSSSFSNDGVRFAVGEQGTTNNGNMLDKGSISVYTVSPGLSLEQKLQHGSGGIINAAQSLCFSPNGEMLFNSYLTGNSGNLTGRVCSWTRSGSVWTQGSSFTNSDSAVNQNFGNMISISGDGLRLAVAANQINNSQGAVYIFKRTDVNNTNWAQEAKIVVSDPTNGSQFGTSIGINFDGSRIIASAPSKTVDGLSQAGAVYLFKRSGVAWSQEQKIVSPTPVSSGQFGSGVSIVPTGDVICCLEAGVPNPKIRLYKLINNVWTFVKQFQTTTSTPVSYGSTVHLSADLSTLLLSNAVYTINSRYGAIFVFG